MIKTIVEELNDPKTEKMVKIEEKTLTKTIPIETESSNTKEAPANKDESIGNSSTDSKDAKDKIPFKTTPEQIEK